MHGSRWLPIVLLAAAAALATAAGCLPDRRGHVEGGALGRVVIYRNGVAFYERSARIEDGRMTVRVPRDKVDDFLKSLTVVDRATGRPLAVTIPRREADDGSYLTMTLETPELQRADVLLTYVTEAPAWKPSYRVVVHPGGKVMFEGWAIVDNTTTEDWNKVKVGVGASSALAFRYDLWSVRRVDRDLLAGEERFATAPPAGVSPYGAGPGDAEELASLGAAELRPGAAGDADVARGETIVLQGSAPVIDRASTTTGTVVTTSELQRLPMPTLATGRTFGSVMSSVPGSAGGGEGGGAAEAPRPPPPPPPVRQGDEKLAAIAGKVLRDRRDVVVEVYGRPGMEQQLAERGNAVRNKLVNDGVPAARIRVVPKVDPSHADNVRVLAAPPAAQADRGAPGPQRARAPGGDTPVGESHFLADRPMTVRAGTSAMVAMVHGETAGGVVYLYDPISERGDPRFAFKAVRLENPTGDTLEPGPVTVYGDGRFIGEGITEPVPPRAAAVVPFALDRQIVVVREGQEEDRIARLVTAQRGIVTTELQHRRRTGFTVTSRLPAPATVYLRHRLEGGWTLVEAPPASARVGDSQLFELRLGPGETRRVAIVEATPVSRTLDLATPDALGMMEVFVQEPDASPQLRAQIEALLATHRAAADLTERLATLRAQLTEYRSRSGELNAQLVTLKAVRTGGELMATLRKKLAEMSERTQQATLGVVEAQEQLMLARVKLQDQLADLRLTDAAARR